MKYLGYILRNVRRNRLRTLLTVGSIGVSLFLMMLMLSFLAINGTVSETLKGSNRLIAMSSQGFAVPLPIRFVDECRSMPGVNYASPLAWFGGSYKDEKMPFAQFGMDADTIAEILEDRKIPPDQLKAFQEDRNGCVIGHKLARERGLNIGDPLPLKGAIYPVDLDLTVRAIYDCSTTVDGRAVYFHWALMEELLKAKNQGRMAGNAGVVYLKLDETANVAEICQKIDAMTLNSDNPTRTMTEDAFVSQFAEMWGDMRTMITAVGFAGLAVLLWYLAVEPIGARLGMPASSASDTPVIGLGHFVTPQFLVFYAYFAACCLSFGAFWFVISPHPWQRSTTGAGRFSTSCSGR